MKALITGGTGFLGTELARVLLAKGDEVIVFDVDPNPGKLSDIKDSVTVASGNLANASELYNIVKASRPDCILHLASMLSVPSNQNPWASFQVNVVGTVNVLEAARLFDVPQVIFTSTVATYGIGTGPEVDDYTLQRPTTMYGTGKLYCECLGRFYRTRFGLDFRTVRFPSVLGPGAKVKHVAQYYAWMIEYPALGNPFECFVAPETKGPGMYFKDAIHALDLVSRAPREQIETVNYNVAGIVPTPSAAQIEQAVKKVIPDAVITYNPEQPIMEYYKTMRIEVFDDTPARQEWGWESKYGDLDTVVADFIHELRTNPARYGL